MTIRSMTGFGRGHAQAGGVRVDVEVSSVNRKQLDVLVNMPRPLQSLESLVVEQVSPHLSRGRVQVLVNVQSITSREQSPIRINTALAKACVAELRRMARQLDISPDISISEVARLPGIIEVRDAGHDPEVVRPALASALEKALAALDNMRKREGKALLADVSQRIGFLEKLSAQILRRAPQLTASFRDALRQRIAAVVTDVEISDERLEKEVIVYADRCDVTEELTRLRSHFGQARQIIGRKEPAGRSLDFLAQEMFREINTIGSKASDAEITPVVVQFKTELERFREQVQNIE